MYRALILGSLLVFVNVGVSTFTELSAREDGTFAVSTSKLVLISEFFKLLLAVALTARSYLVRKGDGNRLQFSLSSSLVLKLAVPAFLYTAGNILVYINTGLLGSTNYQLLSNLKLLVTVLVFRSLIKKRLKVIQWFCILFVICGLLVASIGKSAPTTNHDTDFPHRNDFYIGSLSMIIQAACSAFAGVYLEVLLKGCPQHPMLQNAVLYTWTCLFCVLKYHTEKRPSDGALHSTFNGFSWSIWGAIFLSASYGQVVALVFYYCDNIVKVFANATTVYVSAFVDVIAFGRTVTLQIWIAGFMIALSTITYYCDHPLLLKDDSDFVGILCYSGGKITPATEKKKENFR